MLNLSYCCCLYRRSMWRRFPYLREYKNNNRKMRDIIDRKEKLQLHFHNRIKLEGYDAIVHPGFITTAYKLDAAKEI